MSTGNFKQDVYEQLARVAKAIGHANRLELLEFVSQGPRSVDETVPLADVEAWVARTPTARLVALDDDHSLVASVPRIFDEAVRFLEER